MEPYRSFLHGLGVGVTLLATAAWSAPSESPIERNIERTLTQSRLEMSRPVAVQSPFNVLSPELAVRQFDNTVVISLPVYRSAFVPDPDLDLSLKYASDDRQGGGFGEKWRLNLMPRLEDSGSRMVLVWPGASPVEFVARPDGVYENNQFGKSRIDKTERGYHYVGPRLTATFDAFGKIASMGREETPHSRVHFIYDTSERLSEIRFFQKEKIVFEHNHSGLVERMRMPNQRQYDFFYDANDQLVSVKSGTDVLQLTWEERRVSAFSLNETRRWRVSHIGPNGQVVEVMDANGETRRYSRQKDAWFVEDAGGLVRQKIERVAGRTRYQDVGVGYLDVVPHPVFSSLPGVLEFADGESLHYEYDESGRLISISDRYARQWVYAWEDGLLKRVETPDGGMVSYEYNSVGQLERLRGNDIQRVFSYSESGQLSESLASDGGWGRIVYDQVSGLPVEYSSNLGSLMMSYDDQRRFFGLDVNGEPFMDCRYDDLGRLARCLNLFGEEYHLAFNPTGLVERVQQGDFVTWEYKYDQSARLIGALKNKEVLADVYHKTTENGGFSVVQESKLGIDRYEFDPGGRPIKQVNESGDVVEYSYDDQRENLTVARQDTPGMVIERDNGEIVSIRNNGLALYDYVRNPAGRAIRATSPVNSTVAMYDVDGGEVVRQIKAGNDEKVYFQRWSNQKPVTLRYPSGMLVQYGYDDAGNVRDVLLGEGGKIHLSEVARSAKSHTIRIDYPSGVSEERTQSGLNRLESMRIILSEKEDIGVSYGYDDNGLLREKGEVSGEMEHSCTYHYNSQGLIASFVCGDAADMPPRIYDYSGLGHRVSVAVGDSVDGAVYLGDQLKQFGSRRFEYDPLGNVVKDVGGRTNRAFGFDVLGALAEARVGEGLVTFGYDSDGYVRSVLSGEGRTEYDVVAGRVLSVYRDGNLHIEYVYLPGMGSPIAAVYHPPVGGRHEVFFHYDHEGSPIYITSESGEVLNRYQYSPFGEVLHSEERVENAISYRGMRRYANIGLYEQEARFYDPSLGLFLSPRSRGMNVSPAQSNRYILEQSKARQNLSLVAKLFSRPRLEGRGATVCPAVRSVSQVEHLFCPGILPAHEPGSMLSELESVLRLALAVGQSGGGMNWLGAGMRIGVWDDGEDTSPSPAEERPDNNVAHPGLKVLELARPPKPQAFP